MSTQNFFKKKREWSKIKDDLLAHYLTVYFSKILTTNKTVNYIDCFAGKGKFDDGELGSPLIAVNVAELAKQRSNASYINISYHFIEKEFASDLENNTNKCDALVYNNSYELCIEDILRRCYKENVFMYIDPFGIKNLSFELYQLCQSTHFYSVEMLLNLNSWGFIRECHRLLKLSKDDLTSGDFKYFERGDFNSNRLSSPNDMSNLLGDDYWINIVKQNFRGEITSHEAEDLFVNQYCRSLNKTFKYVTNIPIKATKLKNMPKYRMVFCTNHTHGLIEMAKDMNKRWQEMIHIDTGGSYQLTLFDNIEESNTQNIYEYDFNGDFSKFDLKEKIKSLLDYSKIRYDELLCKIICKHSILYSIEKIKECLLEMENCNEIEIIRTPSHTDRGKKTTFMDYKRDITVRLKNES